MQETNSGSTIVVSDGRRSSETGLDSHFGGVVIAFCPLSNGFIRRKVIASPDRPAIEMLVKEAEFRAQMNNPHLQQILSIEAKFSQSSEVPHKLVLEFEQLSSPLTDLFSFALQSNSYISHVDLTFILFHLSSALSQIHQRGFFHGRISPKNVHYIKETHITKLYSTSDLLIFPQEAIKIYQKDFQANSSHYISPKLFELILSDSEISPINFAKEDAFAMGLMILELGIGESLQNIYQANGFNYQLLSDSIEKLKKYHSVDNIMMVSTIESLLQVEEIRRPTPSILLRDLPPFESVKPFLDQELSSKKIGTFISKANEIVKQTFFSALSKISSRKSVTPSLEGNFSHERRSDLTSNIELGGTPSEKSQVDNVAKPSKNLIRNIQSFNSTYNQPRYVSAFKVEDNIKPGSLVQLNNDNRKISSSSSLLAGVHLEHKIEEEQQPFAEEERNQDSFFKEIPEDIRLKLSGGKISPEAKALAIADSVQLKYLNSVSKENKIHQNIATSPTHIDNFQQDATESQYSRINKLQARSLSPHFTLSPIPNHINTRNIDSIESGIKIQKVEFTNSSSDKDNMVNKTNQVVTQNRDRSSSEIVSTSKIGKIREHKTFRIETDFSILPRQTHPQQNEKTINPPVVQKHPISVQDLTPRISISPNMTRYTLKEESFRASKFVNAEFSISASKSNEPAIYTRTSNIGVPKIVEAEKIDMKINELKADILRFSSNNPSNPSLINTAFEAVKNLQNFQMLATSPKGSYIPYELSSAPRSSSTPPMPQVISRISHPIKETNINIYQNPKVPEVPQISSSKIEQRVSSTFVPFEPLSSNNEPMVCPALSREKLASLLQESPESDKKKGSNRTIVNGALDSNRGYSITTMDSRLRSTNSRFVDFNFSKHGDTSSTSFQMVSKKFAPPSILLRNKTKLIESETSSTPKFVSDAFKTANDLKSVLLEESHIESNHKENLQSNRTNMSFGNKIINNQGNVLKVQHEGTPNYTSGKQIFKENNLYVRPEENRIVKSRFAAYRTGN